jgi:hypothetical protein
MSQVIDIASGEVKSPAVPASPKQEKFDLQDLMLLAGFISLETGVAVIYWPAAFILAGLIFLTSVAAIQKAKSAPKVD